MRYPPSYLLFGTNRVADDDTIYKYMMISKYPFHFRAVINAGQEEHVYWKRAFINTLGNTQIPAILLVLTKNNTASVGGVNWGICQCSSCGLVYWRFDKWCPGCKRSYPMPISVHGVITALMTGRPLSPEKKAKIKKIVEAKAAEEEKGLRD